MRTDCAIAGVSFKIYLFIENLLVSLELVELLDLTPYFCKELQRHVGKTLDQNLKSR